MKLLIDVDALEAGGKVTPSQAAMLRRQATADTGAFAINVLLSLGVIAIVAGIFALEPSVGLALGLGLAEADDGRQPGGLRGLRLGADQLVGLGVVGAAFGMADDDIAAAGVG